MDLDDLLGNTTSTPSVQPTENKNALDFFNDVG
jgi:hypothetical protein